MTSKTEALILEQLAEISRKLDALTVQPASNNTISPAYALQIKQLERDDMAARAARKAAKK